LYALRTKFYKICQLVSNIDIVDLGWEGGSERTGAPGSFRAFRRRKYTNITGRRQSHLSLDRAVTSTSCVPVRHTCEMLNHVHDGVMTHPSPYTYRHEYADHHKFNLLGKASPLNYSLLYTQLRVENVTGT